MKQVVFAGVDVGGRRKGFHYAVLSDDAITCVGGATAPSDVADLLLRHGVRLTAIDSPRAPAPNGERIRPCEREFMKEAICNIRFTPDRAGLDANPTYYEWIDHGFELYRACLDRGLAVVECFPTASWTRWAGKRAGERRSRWTRDALSAQGLRGVPSRTNQDVRDAIAAALTAISHHDGRTQAFGDLVIPR